MVEQGRERGRGPALLFIGVLGLLIASNIVCSIRNQQSYPWYRSLALRGDQSLAQRAARGPDAPVMHRYAIYYLLAERSPGVTATVPHALSRHQWALEGLAKMRVRTVDDRLELPRNAVAAVAARGAEPRQLDRAPLHILFEPGTDDYVLATIAGDEHLLWLPRGVFVELGGSEEALP